jgi:hypothetical protein
MQQFMKITFKALQNNKHMGRIRNAGSNTHQAEVG